MFSGIACSSTPSSTDLYFRPTPPPGKDGQWMNTNPSQGWFFYIRLYAGGTGVRRQLEPRRFRRSEVENTEIFYGPFYGRARF